MAAMREMSDRIKEVLVESASHLNKNNVMSLLERVSEMVQMMMRVLLENERLKGQLSECRMNDIRNTKERKVMVRSYAGMTARSAPSVNVVSVQTPVRMNEKHAVMVRSTEQGMSSADIKKRVMNEVRPTVANVRVNALRMVRNGGVAIETASAEKLCKLKTCGKFNEVGLKVESPRKVNV